MALTAMNLGVWYYGNQAPPGGVAVTNRMLSKLWTWGVKAAYGRASRDHVLSRKHVGVVDIRDRGVWQPGPGGVATWTWGCGSLGVAGRAFGCSEAKVGGDSDEGSRGRLLLMVSWFLGSLDCSLSLLKPCYC